MPTRQHDFITMDDGVRLAASLYVPDGDGPWPAVLEALPYRKDDDTAAYRPEYERVAAAGYVVCRVDLRGTGSSEGIAEDEYPAVERTDMLTVIDWLATREWSTGTVGMYGTSYSGFNSIQLAMERPPALKAIIPIYATDDRYADDVHYFGGAVKQLDLVDYPTYMIAMNALPPVPSIYGDGWREEWERRVRGTEPWVLTWLEHQRFDDYWRFGSLRPDYDQIEAATMIVAGWADGYRNNSLRTFEALRCPTRLLIGPWAHAATDTSLPGPNIDLVPEMIRWWDRWLKDEDNGIDREPPIVLFAQRSTRPGATRPEMQGGWRYEPTWPAERLRPTPLALSDAEAVAPIGDDGDVLDVRGDVGWTAWISCAGHLPWGQPDDQRPDEAYSLTYTWPALERDLEILGHARLAVTLTSSAPIAYLSAKLCDVFPDGASSLVTRTMLNLAHRDSREEPSPLEPGERYEVTFDLEAASWTFEAGHRIRLDLAGTDWPNAWTPPGARDAHDRPSRDDDHAPGARRAVAGRRGAVVRAAASRRRGRRRRPQPRTWRLRMEDRARRAVGGDARRGGQPRRLPGEGGRSLVLGALRGRGEGPAGRSRDRLGARRGVVRDAVARGDVRGERDARRGERS